MKHSKGKAHLILGLAIIAISMATMVLGRSVVAAHYVGGSSFLLYVIGGFGVMSGFLLVKRGLRHLQAHAEKVLEQDPRPPVLYLRAFVDDSTQQDSLGFKGSADLFIPEPRIEETIAPLLNCIGPMVAIGRPGEPLPELGAYRLYVDDEHWKEKVTELMERACMVVIFGKAHTEGVHWEIKEVIKNISPEKIVFFFPFPDKTLESHYADFVSATAGYFPKELPGSIGSYAFLCFEHDWTPILIGADQHSNAAIARQSALMKLIQRTHPDFKEPPLKVLVGEPKYYTLIAIGVITVTLVVAFVGLGIYGYMHT